MTSTVTRWVYKVMLGNDNEEDVFGVGTCKLRLRRRNTLLLYNTLYASGVRVCLLSIVSLIKLEFFFNSHIDGLDLVYDGNVFGHTTLKNDFLVLDLDDSCNNSSSIFVSHFSSDFESIKWHRRLDHINQDRMNRLAKEDHLDCLTKVKLPRCESCLADKATAKPSDKATAKPFDKASRASSPLELIHSYMCRSMNVKTHHWAFYFLTFIDDYSSYGYIYLLSHRYEALDLFKQFIVKVDAQLEPRVKI